ncbi:MAG: hypothetical protein K0R14_1349 [Burkholderiales bacterium]|nr:hypothetical protein [Burkholderiales bacterium]
MKKLNMPSTLFGILCALVLGVCVGDSNIGPGPSRSDNAIFNSTKTASSQKAKAENTDSMLTSFTLWNENDVNTISAGEIIGNNITVQLPADTITTASVMFKLTFTGADTISTNGIQIKNNTDVQIDLNAPMVFTATKDGISKNYTVSFIKREPYFKFYDKANTCIRDIDGNIWTKTPNKVIKGGQWKDTLNYVNDSFSACGIPLQKWTLPSTVQAQAIINTVPLNFQYPSQTSPDTAPLAWFNAQTESNVKLLNLPNVVDFWTQEDDSSKKDYALAMRLGATKPKIVSIQNRNYFSVAWPVSSGDGSDAKTITNFTFTPQNELPIQGIVAGNLIFLVMPPLPEHTIMRGGIAVSATGGTVSINGISQLDNYSFPSGAPPSFPPILPVTVTAKNGKKNIYSLIVRSSSSFNTITGKTGNKNIFSSIISSGPAFTSFAVFDSIANTMVPGIIDNEKNTITVQLADGASLYTKVFFSTSFPIAEANVMVNNQSIMSSQSVHFDDENGNNIPVQFTINEDGLLDQTYSVTVLSNSTSQCDCTPIGPKSTCSCPYTPWFTLLKDGGVSNYHLICTNPNYPYPIDWGWSPDDNGVACFKNMGTTPKMENITCKNWNIGWGEDKHVQLKIMCGSTLPKDYNLPEDDKNRHSQRL